MKRQSYFNRGLLRYTKAEEQVLKSRLEVIRATITHPAEKGRSVEVAIREFLRSMLPAEYGLSTGFIAYHALDCVEEREFTQDGMPVYECRYCAEKDEIRVSPQIDIIIYDALRFGPIVRLEACDVFPAEAVYAYAEFILVEENRQQPDAATTGFLVVLRKAGSRNLRPPLPPVPP